MTSSVELITLPTMSIIVLVIPTTSWVSRYFLSHCDGHWSVFTAESFSIARLDHNLPSWKSIGCMLKWKRRHLQITAISFRCHYYIVALEQLSLLTANEPRLYIIPVLFWNPLMLGAGNIIADFPEINIWRNKIIMITNDKHYNLNLYRCLF